MNISFTLPLTLLLIAFSNQALADRENDMWQQFKAQKGMKELDAEFGDTKPQPQPEPRVVERVIERVIERPAPAPAPQAEPEPVIIAQPETIPEATPEPVSQTSMVTIESDGYIFKLGSCKLAHLNIKCQLTIASIEKDGGLTLYSTYSSYSSKLFDYNGNEYHPSSVTMGNKSSGSKNYVVNKYISGVTARGSIEFENVDSSTNSISMFELSLHNPATKKYKRIQFRDVALSL